MKLLIFLTVFTLFAVMPSLQLLTCEIPPGSVPKEWTKMDDQCISILRAQVQEELKAAMTYLNLGAHFSQDTVNRPGFAKFFLESASEERQHAMKIIEYMLMRGQLTGKNSIGGERLRNILPIIDNPKPVATTHNTGAQALKAALELETSVTEKIRNIIVTCEEPPVTKYNDYHLVDWLTGEYLEEQYKGQRDIAGKLSTLSKLMATHGELGEFLFDKKMLHGEI
uniref:Ferritin n=1 Tax=Clastoptera arizonana TaxID=38151 RepID=A0A1B6CHM7_9HEMI